MIKPKFYGTIQGGKFVLNHRELLENYLKKFPDGKEMEMTVGSKYKKRTQGAPGEETNFNGYYWGVVIRIISDEMGELDDKVTHNLLQMMFNRKFIDVVDPDDKHKFSLQIPAGTSEMSGQAFADYCSKIRMWAAIPGNLTDKGIYIPEPHEADYEQ